MFYTGDPTGTVSYGRGAPRPVVPGVLRTPDGVVNVRPKAMRGPRKAAGLPKSLVRSPPRRRPEAQTVLKKSNCLNFQVEHDGRHHPVQNSKPCRKLRLVMLDWLGAPTWHFARSILNTTTGYSNSRFLGPPTLPTRAAGVAPGTCRPSAHARSPPTQSIPRWILLSPCFRLILRRARVARDFDPGCRKP